MEKCSSFIKKLTLKYIDDEIQKEAIVLTYNFLFSLFPLIIFISNVIGYLKIPESTLLLQLEPILPESALSIIEYYLSQVNVSKDKNLMFFSLFLTIYFPLRAINYLVKAIEKSYGVLVKRKFLRHWLVVIIFTIILYGSIIVSFFLIPISSASLEFLSRFFEISEDLIVIWDYIKYIIFGLILVSVLSFLYLISCGKKNKFGYIFPGAMVSLCIWLFISMAYSYYVDNMANYSAIYGSIGAIIVMLIWLQLTSTSILLGAEINSVLFDMDEDIEEEKDLD